MDQRPNAIAGYFGLRRRDLIALLGSAAIAGPLTARAEQKAMPVIGFLGSGWPSTSESRLVGLRQGLAETGYVEGQNVAIEYRWAEGSYDRLPALAAQLVRRNVDVIIASGPPAAGSAKNTTSILPIVFVVGDDPVATGLVASIAQPSGNLTGVSILNADLMPKRLQLLSELIPQARMIALLVNTTFAATELIIREVQAAARNGNTAFDPDGQYGARDR
jgi:putative tryptophan/tyrosine transport system substrate-binding protein